MQTQRILGLLGVIVALIAIIALSQLDMFTTQTSSTNTVVLSQPAISSFLQNTLQPTIDTLLQRTDFHNCIEDIKKLQLLPSDYINDSTQSQLQHFLALCEAVKTARENIEKGTNVPTDTMIHFIRHRNPSDSKGKAEKKTQHPNYQFLTKKQQEVLTAYTEILSKMANKENGYNVKNKQELKQKFDSKKTAMGNSLKNKNRHIVTKEENKIKEYFTTIGIAYDDEDN